MNLLKEPYEMMFHTVAARKKSSLMAGMTGANVPSVKPNSNIFSLEQKKAGEKGCVGRGFFEKISNFARFSASEYLCIIKLHFPPFGFRWRWV
jgi:hypothetical protein